MTRSAALYGYMVKCAIHQVHGNVWWSNTIIAVSLLLFNRRWPPAYAETSSAAGVQERGFTRRLLYRGREKSRLLHRTFGAHKLKC